MKKAQTLFLKVTVILIGIAVIALCIFVLPWLANEMNQEGNYLQNPILAVLYATTIPFFFGLYETLKLLNYIDIKNAFSELSIKALKNIKYSAIVISILYIIGMPFLYIMVEKYDAPGILLLEIIVTFAAIVVAVFASVLQRILEEAIEKKMNA